ncbi:chorismate mutase [Aggregatibacter actinomycetemcomitans]|uniref:hypothetical protein n=1 Tax=Aggregatibacter actinomycetemcomitans TaxID=714 RepID=UPI00077E062A|nr:chorismate mutase [Aggregatibacter actinomycetemcomitans]
MGLSPNLIEDVLRRIMRESYVSENQFGFKTVIRKFGKSLSWADEANSAAYFVVI